MPSRPRDTYHVVMSVPHSGTRTLREYLSKERPEIVPPGWDRIGQWHFNFHPHLVAKFFLYANENPGERKAYIPVRNPIDVADSWERRYGDAKDKAAFEMNGAIGLMVGICLNHARHLEIFKMEELPVLRGFGPQPEGWEKIGMDHPRVEGLRKMMRENKDIHDFYRGMYNDEELWWL